MNRLLRPPEIDRQRQQEPFDPVLEGARHGLSRELALKVWERVVAEADPDRGEGEEAQRRFQEVAALVAARGERSLALVGKVTRAGVEGEGHEVDEQAAPGKGTRAVGEEDAPSTWLREWFTAHPRGEAGQTAVPGRRTLIGPTQGQLDFDDYRVLGLRNVLKQLGPKHPLRGEVIAAAAEKDRAITGRATQWREQLPAAATPVAPTPGGAALWQVAERHTVTLYRRALGSGKVDKHDPAIEAALQQRGNGQPLPEGLRKKLEAELGLTLSGVRIHTDAVAAKAARALNAQAFAVGEDIFFAPGAYAPETTAGRKLLVHELTHVGQSLRGKHPANAVGGLRVSEPDEGHEQEAEAAAERAGQAPAAGDDAAAAAAPDAGGEA
jgi:hypothetical protein